MVCSLHLSAEIEIQATGELTLRPCKGFGTLIHNNPEALNPFQRFKYRHYDSAADYLAEIWDPDSVGGHVLEAMVACHLEHTKACFHCQKQGALRWNGGFCMTSAWADVVCIHCYAMYEIKSKRDQKTVRKNIITYNQIRGGDFLAFSRFKPLGERYLVMVSRTPAADGCDAYHPVTIAIIDRVVPKLTSNSFDLGDGDEIRIGSEISIKPESRTTWCTVPPCDLPYYELAESVYDRAFGIGEWKKRNPSKKKWLGINEESLVASFQSIQISRRTPGNSRSSLNNINSRYDRQNNHPLPTRQAITIGPRYDTAAILRGYRHRQHDEDEDNMGDYYMSDYNRKQQRKYKKSSSGY